MCANIYVKDIKSLFHLVMCWYFQSWSVDFGKQNICCASLSCNLRDHTSLAISAATTGLHRTRSYESGRRRLLAKMRNRVMQGVNRQLAGLQQNLLTRDDDAEYVSASISFSLNMHYLLVNEYKVNMMSFPVSRKFLSLIQVPFGWIPDHVAFDPTNVQTSFDCNWSGSII